VLQLSARKLLADGSVAPLLLQPVRVALQRLRSATRAASSTTHPLTGPPARARPGAALGRTAAGRAARTDGRRHPARRRHAAPAGRRPTRHSGGGAEKVPRCILVLTFSSGTWIFGALPILPGLGGVVLGRRTRPCSCAPALLRACPPRCRRLRDAPQEENRFC